MAKRTIILLLLLALTMGVALPAAASADATGELSYALAVPAGREGSIPYLQDNDYHTRFTLTPGQTLSVTWEGEAGGVFLQWFNEKQWYSRPCCATIRMYSAEGCLLSETIDSQLAYRMFLPAEGVNRVDILCSGRNHPMISLCELKVYAPGYEPNNLPKREPVDLMLILSGVSDELDLMGGLLPLYAGEHGVRTAVVYLGRDDGDQVQEAFHALEAMGLDVIPLFLQREDHLTYNVSRIPSLWKEGVLRDELANLLKTYTPRVVVTCDPDDESTAARTFYTGRLVRSIVERAERQLPLQKLYYLSKSGSTAVDGTIPLAVYDGQTAVDVARAGYARYRSEASFHTVIPESPRFTLCYTTVGEDKEGNDLFEHIDTGDLLAYQAPTPIPTATPEPTPTEAPTEAPLDTPAAVPAAPTAVPPTAAPTDVPVPAPEAEGEITFIQRLLSLGKGTLALYAVSGVFVIVALCMVKKRRTTSLLLLVMAGLLVYVAYSNIKARDEALAEDKAAAISNTPVPTEAPTATPAPTDTPSPTDTFAPTEAPTATPAPTPTPEPTPAPDPDDQYFRQPGEAEEVVIQDYENGHWEYRSDILSVIIDRVITYERQNHPYWKYVAHVRMRKVNSFRTGVSTRNEITQANEPPWRLARNYRAVLAVTGDNINNADVELKGILIRNGILYSDERQESTMVIDDDLTMRVYHPGEISGLDLLDSGVISAFSFGPILVENGQVNPDADKHRVFKENPRCGVGMVEPGHFVVIVSDGRDDDRAYGYTLGEFAQVFANEGVQVAYNLDGGNSAGMVFMGEHINWHSVGSQRTWADALIWGCSTLVPKADDPVNHYGDGALH